MADRACDVGGCEKRVQSAGLCSMHYARLRLHGDVRHQRTALDRMTDRIDASGDCWLWTGRMMNNGYGRFGHRGVAAHRAVYEALVGPIPPGREIDHLCRQRACVNPDHMEPVTPSENQRRSHSVSGLNAAKTHCPQGHPYAGDNLTFECGSRICRTCKAAKLRRLRARRKELVAC